MRVPIHPAGDPKGVCAAHFINGKQAADFLDDAILYAPEAEDITVEVLAETDTPGIYYVVGTKHLTITK